MVREGAEVKLKPKRGKGKNSVPEWTLYQVNC